MSFVKNAVTAAALLAVTSAAFAMSPTAEKKEVAVKPAVTATTMPVAAKDLVPVAATQGKPTQAVAVTAMPMGSAVAAPVAGTKSTPTQKPSAEKKVEHKADHKAAPVAK